MGYYKDLSLKHGTVGEAQDEERRDREDRVYNRDALEIVFGDRRTLDEVKQDAERSMGIRPITTLYVDETFKPSDELPEGATCENCGALIDPDEGWAANAIGRRTVYICEDDAFGGYIL